MDPDSDEKYWNYSFEEVGDYDIMAAMDFIKIKKPQEQKIDIVSYSQGTSAMIYAMSEHPDHFEKRVGSAVALAPAIYFSNSGE